MQPKDGPNVLSEHAFFQQNPELGRFGLISSTTALFFISFEAFFSGTWLARVSIRKRSFCCFGFVWFVWFAFDGYLFCCVGLLLSSDAKPALSIFNGQLEWLAKSYQEWGSDKLVERAGVFSSCYFEETLMHKRCSWCDASRKLQRASSAFFVVLVLFSRIIQVIYFHCDCGRIPSMFLISCHSQTQDGVELHLFPFFGEFFALVTERDKWQELMR